MHAGEAKNGSDQRAYGGKFPAGSGQRAHGGKFPAGSGETTMPAVKKCTPARRRTAATSGHTEANSPPPASK
ncbi:hypothetical protein [Bianquea renquensis]|uniref:Uncharacterized protein n=1 Tax=Bianquea renquensis TaxID=2763661 RepID=A0A926DXM9_9FIRM|nr:hypothetical protein [Bianquea renquensis]MBC8545100.1 hypothetical protein [Bianquea renquensis]